MLHIAVVEDDKTYVETLKEYLKQYEKERKERIRITTFSDGEDIATNYKADYDIILLDIEMKFMDGMTTAEEIRKVDNEVVIIFITNMPQYVMKGYEVEALDYVLKPINYFALSQRIDRALSRMKRRSKKYITIALKGGLKKLDISKIHYVEVQNHDLIFHTTEGSYTTKGSMKDLENSINNDIFFRCNKCFLINLEYVESFQNSDVVVGADTLQVSRSRKKELLDMLNNYMNEVSK
ncbi:LytR/AlgR family response regulator transcription factor [Clostridium fungisolvens]|uniref:Stage 0 sporulation protein A homolog n=1 Tax=Clostridium fungisolvens TaxID=1604897 RepID=A0A6V8SJZ2_9CLOT|nr:LytTR family DNA-binding domain-containing protein [Clostridium fungisolvens]GFP77549.1 Transcriptional regulatory protein YpdB [Clostridium fungisolvens]